MIEWFESPDGSTHYKLQPSNQRHRPNGPAIIVPYQGWDWFLFGNYHRYYGPQCSYRTIRGSGEWWVHGTKIK